MPMLTYDEIKETYRYELTVNFYVKFYGTPENNYCNNTFRSLYYQPRILTKEVTT